MSHTLLTIKNLSFGYTDSPLCSGIDFTLNEGEWYALTGRNGVGKTALLRSLCGLTEPLDGEVVSPSGTLSALQVLPEVIYIGHSPGLKLELTVRENLTFYSKLEGESNKNNIEECAHKLQINSILDELCANISQGQLRRTSLCRLTMTQRSIWLLDEPTSALDSAGLDCFGNLLSQHLSQGGCALIATHRELAIPKHTVSGTLELNAYV